MKSAHPSSRRRTLSKTTFGTGHDSEANGTWRRPTWWVEVFLGPTLVGLAVAVAAALLIRSIDGTKNELALLRLELHSQRLTQHGSGAAAAQVQGSGNQTSVINNLTDATDRQVFREDSLEGRVITAQIKECQSLLDKIGDCEHWAPPNPKELISAFSFWKEGTFDKLKAFSPAAGQRFLINNEVLTFHFDYCDDEVGKIRFLGLVFLNNLRAMLK